MHNMQMTLTQGGIFSSKLSPLGLDLIRKLFAYEGGPMVGLTEYTRIRYNISVWKKNVHEREDLRRATLQSLWICYENRVQKHSACRGVRI